MVAKFSEGTITILHATCLHQPMTTRRTFLASLAALAVAPFVPSTRKGFRIIRSGAPKAAEHFRMIAFGNPNVQRCEFGWAEGPEVREWIDEHTGKYGVCHVIKAEKMFPEWDNV